MKHGTNKDKDETEQPTEKSESDVLLAKARRVQLACTLVQWALAQKHVCGDEELAGKHIHITRL
jgi:hypothetical protein